MSRKAHSLGATFSRELVAQLADRVVPTRVLLVDLPRMLLEILTAVLDEQPDLDVREAGDTALEQCLDETCAEVIVTGRDDLGFVGYLLDRHPDLRVFTVSSEGKETFLYELRPHRIPLGQISTQRLVSEIRAGRRTAAGRCHGD